MNPSDPTNLQDCPVCGRFFIGECEHKPFSGLSNYKDITNPEGEFYDVPGCAEMYGVDMDEPKNPREWYVCPKSQYWGDEESCVVNKLSELTERAQAEAIHVIEKSAYDAVCKERDGLHGLRKDLMKAVVSEATKVGELQVDLALAEDCLQSFFKHFNLDGVNEAENLYKEEMFHDFLDKARCLLSKPKVIMDDNVKITEKLRADHAELLAKANKLAEALVDLYNNIDSYHQPDTILKYLNDWQEFIGRAESGKVEK